MKILAKIIRYVRDAWLMIGIAILLLFILEAGFSFFLSATKLLSRHEKSATQSRKVADTYLDSSWVDGYYKEFSRSHVSEWHPYVYWRRPPFDGKYINVDKDGIRRTVLPAAQDHNTIKPVKIFMFGGSAMWGTGARDSFTIPSLMAMEMQSKGLVLDIVNFGESGYVSTQEVIALMVQLQKGNIPDLVVFYDGVNDTFSAFQQRVAGLPQNEANREMEFNLIKRKKARQVTQLVIRNLSEKSSLVRQLRKIVMSRSAGEDEEDLTMNSSSRNMSLTDSTALAQQVLSVYVSNIEIVRALGAHYHFKSLFYWQPTIFQKKNLTKYEMAEREKKNSLTDFIGLTYGMVRKTDLSGKSGNSFHDLSDVFSDEQAPLYVDWCHLGESGNETIAKIMARDVLHLFEASSSARRKQVIDASVGRPKD